MDNDKNIDFRDNTAASESYVCVVVNADLVLESWRDSLFSFQWMTTDGKIKDIDDLPASEQPKRRDVEGAIKYGRPVQKAVLGIGMQDNIEIGSGRAEFLTLAALGYKTLPVHIPKSNADEFAPFVIE